MAVPPKIKELNAEVVLVINIILVSSLGFLLTVARGLQFTMVE